MSSANLRKRLSALSAKNLDDILPSSMAPMDDILPQLSRKLSEKGLNLPEGLSKSLPSLKEKIASIRSSKAFQGLEENLMEASQGSESALKKLKNQLTKTVEYLTADNKGLMILFTVIAVALNLWYWILHGFSIQKAVVVKSQVLQSGANEQDAQKQVEELKIAYPFTAWFGGIATVLLAVGIIFLVLVYVNAARAKLWSTLGLLSMILSVILSLLALGKYYFY
jgi:hypothetical protein